MSNSTFVNEDRRAIVFASEELRSVITFQNGKPIINKKLNRDMRVIKQANKILESDDKLSEQALNKKLTSPVHLSLMSNPVTLRVRDSQNSLIHESLHFYDKDQIQNFKSKSPMTRRNIESVVENEEKKKEILKFAKKVIKRKKKQSSKK